MNDPIPVCTLFKDDASTQAIGKTDDLFSAAVEQSSTSTLVTEPVAETNATPVCNIFQSGGESSTTNDLFSALSLADNNDANLLNGENKNSNFLEDDIFTSALHSSEAARRREAWIAFGKTKTVLETASEIEGKQLIKPGLSTSESLGNPLADLLTKVLPSNDINMKCCLSTDSVSKDEAGLKQLIRTGNFRAAVDLTSTMLTNLGQGFGKCTRDSQNTPTTFQWWNARLALLMHLKLFNVVETELAQFGDLDSPDLYFSYYPGLYTGRRGCMVPFTLRLLHATFPSQRNMLPEAIQRLNSMHYMCQMILKNLEDGKTEDGLVAELKTDDRKASLELWKNRKVLVMVSLGKVLMQMKIFDAAIRIYDQVMTIQPGLTLKLQSCIGRTLLQLGDIKSAQKRFALAEQQAEEKSISVQTQLTMNRAFLYIGANNWKEALLQFDEVIKLDPGKLDAYNNKAVCLLYLCRLRDAIATLEAAVHLKLQTDSNLLTGPDPYTSKQTLENIYSNLVTLYELESTRFYVKKMALVQHIAGNSGDGFDVSCLKL